MTIRLVPLAGGEQFEYAYTSASLSAGDAVDNRTVITSVTPISGTVVTTHTYDAANRLTARGRSDGWAYTYDWSPRGQMLAEWTKGLPARAFTYDGAGHLVEARVLTLTTRFRYNGLGARLAVEVVGRGTTTGKSLEGFFLSKNASGVFAQNPLWQQQFAGCARKLPRSISPQGEIDPTAWARLP